MSKTSYQPKEEIISTEHVLNWVFRDQELQLDRLEEFEDIDASEIKEEIREKQEGKFYIRCPVRNKDILVYNQQSDTAKPEEIIRQLFIRKLTEYYSYPLDRIGVEEPIQFGRERKKSADIVVYKSSARQTPYIVVEVKAPDESGGIEQLKSYLNAKGAELGVWTNGKEKIVLYRPYPQEFVDTLLDIPQVDQSPKDLTEVPLALNDLEKEYDFKTIIQQLEELVLANSGESVFEEVFKLIFAKIYDEKQARTRKNKELRFRKLQDPQLTYERINDLFKKSAQEWPGVFDKHEDINLTPSHLSVSIGPLENKALLGANLRVMDDAFEYLISKEAKGEKGQFFTPRHVIDMCVKMLNPKINEDVMDPAAGSGGFLLHALDWVEKNHAETKDAAVNYAQNHLYGIDFERRMVKVAKALMLIAGDGKAHIYKLNSLDTRTWVVSTNSALRAQADLRKFLHQFSDSPKNRENAGKYKFLDFDVVMTNPPFAGNIREDGVKAEYQLAYKQGDLSNKLCENINRDILFLERCLQLLKPGGRMAIVLPQGDLNNTSTEYVRRWVTDQAKILAVVGLHTNTFKPHTGTKTSVLFLRKWEEDEKIPEDYKIFMATSKEPGKDSSGDYVYKKDEKGNIALDENGNPIIDHDLDEIAEEFAKFARKERFYFWR